MYVATKVGGQIDPNSRIRQDNQSPSNDVWVSQNSVISEWGLGEEDLWARLVDRHNEILLTGGVHADLWKQVDNGQGQRCTCIKQETGQADKRDPICYGTGVVGGYEKFGFSTIFLAASNPGLVLDSGLVLAKKIPWQIELADGKTVGVALSPTFQITHNFGYAGSDLAAQDGLRVLTQNGIKVEYTINNGTDWFPISVIPPLSEPAINVRFRITLTRATVNEPSPFFKMLRARFQMQQDTQVVISKKSFPEQRWLESFGVRVKMDGITWWTTPNLGIIGQPTLLLEEDDLFQVEQGLFQAQTLEDEQFPISGRFKPANVTYVEPRGRFLSQRFNIRALQRDEPELGVF